MCRVVCRRFSFLKELNVLLAINLEFGKWDDSICTVHTDTYARAPVRSQYIFANKPWSMCILNQNFFRFHRLGVFHIIFISFSSSAAFRFLFLHLSVSEWIPLYTSTLFPSTLIMVAGIHSLTHSLIRSHRCVFSCQVFYKIYFVIRFIHLCRRRRHRHRFHHRQLSTTST